MSKQQTESNYNAQNRGKRAGDVFISKNKKTGKAKSDVVGGDYVDFEEL